MTQDEIIEMARQAGFDFLNGWQDNGESCEYAEAWPEQIEAFAKLVAAKAFENGFYAGFEASGEGWNGEWPFRDKGIDICKDEGIQYALKEARGEAND